MQDQVTAAAASPAISAAGGAITAITTPTETTPTATTSTTIKALSRYLPTPDQLCRPGEGWGVDQRWVEPWDESAAQATVEKLLAHWHRWVTHHNATSAAVRRYMTAAVHGCWST